MVFKPSVISGFPEWLPEVRLVEQRWMDTIRGVFESYGFCNIETAAVEEIDALSAKGEVDKEIYGLRRLQAEPGDDSGRLALHYDLTVPMARYVALNFNNLTFPFKRYQMQKVWRGERPQKGRFREFYQCDIDVVAVDNLPLHFDAELPAVMHDVLTKLGIADVRLHISNRKILQGFLEGLFDSSFPRKRESMTVSSNEIVHQDKAPDQTISCANGNCVMDSRFRGNDDDGEWDDKNSIDATFIIRILDKMDKVGMDGVKTMLTEVGLPVESAQKCIELASIRTPDTSFVDKVRALGIRHDLLEQGLDELKFVMEHLAHLPEGSVLADLSIARGFDYYTGTVYEGKIASRPDLGSVVAGGRYDDLAGSFINKKLPGVGVSLGLSRLFSKLVEDGSLSVGPSCPTDVLVVLPSEEKRALAAETARALRKRGLKVEVFHAPKKIGDQFKYAEKKGITRVWIPPFEDGQPHEVKNLVTREQTPVDVENWRP